MKDSASCGAFSRRIVPVLADSLDRQQTRRSQAQRGTLHSFGFASSARVSDQPCVAALCSLMSTHAAEMSATSCRQSSRLHFGAGPARKASKRFRIATSVRIASTPLHVGFTVATYTRTSALSCKRQLSTLYALQQQLAHEATIIRPLLKSMLYKCQSHGQ